MATMSLVMIEVCFFSFALNFFILHHKRVSVCCKQVQAGLLQPAASQPRRLPALFLPRPLAGLLLLQSLCSRRHHFRLHGRYKSELNQCGSCTCFCTIVSSSNHCQSLQGTKLPSVPGTPPNISELVNQTFERIERK